MNANNNLRAIECLLSSQNTNMLQSIVHSLTDECPNLNDIRDRLMANGFYKLAIICEKKVDAKAALDTCVRLELWKEATSLVNESGLKDQLLNIAKDKYEKLLQQNQHFGAFQLCQSVELYSDAARILSDLIERKNKEETIPHNMAKKIFILGAGQVERHREKVIDLKQFDIRGRKAKGDIASSIEQLMNDDNSNVGRMKNKNDSFKKFWRNAAAHHYFLIAHTHLYTERMDLAIKSAIKCCDFNDILSPIKVFSLIALTSYLSGYYGVCSYAMTRLRLLPTVDKTINSALEILVRIDCDTVIVFINTFFLNDNLI